MKIGIYRIFNMNVSREGEPFFMCDSCYTLWHDRVGHKFVVNKIGDATNRECEGPGNAEPCTESATSEIN
jgi:hypothetical protein